MQLTGKVVLVTGAQQGIGRAMSREFAAAGADDGDQLAHDDGGPTCRPRGTRPGPARHLGPGRREQNRAGPSNGLDGPRGARPNRRFDQQCRSVSARPVPRDDGARLGPCLGCQPEGVVLLRALAKTPIPKRAEYKRDVTARGLESRYVEEAVKHHEKLLSWIEESTRTGAYLAGDVYSLADAAVIPYIARLELLGLDKMWADRPGVSSWWQRVRNRPSTKETIWKRMTDVDWAPFKNVQPDPWPKVRGLLTAASAKGAVPCPAMPSN